MITPQAHAQLAARYTALKELEIALRTGIRIATELDLVSVQDSLDLEVEYCLRQQLCTVAAMADAPSPA